MKKILEAAKGMQDRLVEYRRHIHANAELGMETKNTAAFVVDKLRAMGYEPEMIAGNGVVALVGGKKSGKTVLLRADMDALPIQEEADIDYKCKTGAMHACGHDFHTTMLFGAAEILKGMEDEIEGTVKLMFQPGEEILAGAKAMFRRALRMQPSKLLDRKRSLTSVP